jgi:hypothetical protein
MAQWLGPLLAVLIFAAPDTFRGFARDSALLPEQATAGKKTPVGQTQTVTVDRILPERAKAVLEAGERILKAIGENREVNQSDLRLHEAYEKASAALDIKLVVESRHFTYGKRFRRARLQETIDVSKRVVGAFNKDGGDAHFSSIDLDTLQAIQFALVAAETIQKANSPALARKLGKEKIQAGVEASQRVLDEFNEKGGHASFGSADKGILRTFAEALRKPK